MQSIFSEQFNGKYFDLHGFWYKRGETGLQGLKLKF